MTYNVSSGTLSLYSFMRTLQGSKLLTLLYNECLNASSAPHYPVLLSLLAAASTPYLWFVLFLFCIKCCLCNTAFALSYSCNLVKTYFETSYRYNV